MHFTRTSPYLLPFWISTFAVSSFAHATSCGEIVNSCKFDFTAKEAYDCLVSVPFNAAVATNFIKYFNDTIQYQSTFAYLKNPPSTYQQPAIDVPAGLEHIQSQIDQGAFPNQYAFEAALQKLIYAAHDSHFQLQAGILAAFNFYSPYSIVSLSKDGIQSPKIFVTDDVSLFGSSTEPSAIKSINGQDVTAYLTKFGAANSPGNLESHADWNSLMSSSATYIVDDYNIWESYITLYPGETITLAFENGTTLDPEPWRATYNSPGPTGPLSTGGDFYNFFVLGQYPASFDENAPDPCEDTSDDPDPAMSEAVETIASTQQATSWPDSAYPDKADIYQPDLYPFGQGVITGYFLKDISTAVLSIPSFEARGEVIKDFSDTIQKFLTESHAAGMQKVLIDLQQNKGGNILLAVETFKHFFPSKDSFRGSRLRAHAQADKVGNAFSDYFVNGEYDSEMYASLSGSPWTAPIHLRADTGQNFSSWAEFFGPHDANGDHVTAVFRDNITSSIFNRKAFGNDIYGESIPATTAQLYDPTNIILLTDGLCSSSCALFHELMHYEAGVKSVVVGGLPQSGPMQADSGTRGTQLYIGPKIDDDIEIAKLLNATELPDRDVDLLISYFSINLRDHIRKGQETPLQFAYDAADCRIFYTAETVTDYSKLWSAAVKSVNDPALCVANSTGFAVRSSDSQPPTPAPNPQTTAYDIAKLLGPADGDTNIFEGQQLGIFHPEAKGSPRAVATSCNNHGRNCPNDAPCNFKKAEGKGKYLGRSITFRSGDCPVAKVAKGKSSLKELLTRPDQPSELNYRRDLSH